jgi:cobalamin biosynthetic protein CobC
LPDGGETAILECAAARAFGVSAAAVLATAGAETGIRLLAGTLGPRRVAVVQPTYSGHATAWREAGATVVGVTRQDIDQAAEHFDVIVAVNPNNPDGAVLPPERLIAIAERLAAKDGWLIVDEAFVEAVPDVSVAHAMAQDWSAERLVALRSFGKFYGLPGVRLGFVTAHPQFVERLRRKLGDWPVSADAIAAGIQAYKDPFWAPTIRPRLDEAARRLDTILVKSGFQVVGGTSLFRLAAAEDAHARFLRLADAGVLTRPFTYAPTWLRFGLPAPQHWLHLEAALMESVP